MPATLTPSSSCSIAVTSTPQRTSMFGDGRHARVEHRLGARLGDVHERRQVRARRRRRTRRRTARGRDGRCVRGATSAPPRRSRRRRPTPTRRARRAAGPSPSSRSGRAAGRRRARRRRRPSRPAAAPLSAPPGPFPTTTTCGIYRDHMTIAITGASGTLGRLIAGAASRGRPAHSRPISSRGLRRPRGRLRGPRIGRARAGGRRPPADHLAAARGRAARASEGRGRRRCGGGRQAPALHLDHRPVGLQPRLRRRRAPRHRGGDTRDRGRVDVPAQLDLHRDAGADRAGRARRRARCSRTRATAPRPTSPAPTARRRRPRCSPPTGTRARRTTSPGRRRSAPSAQAVLFSELGGRPVTVTHVDDDAWVAAMVEHAGLPEPAARVYSTFGKAARLGLLRQRLDHGRGPHRPRAALRPRGARRALLG